MWAVHRFINSSYLLFWNSVVDVHWLFIFGLSVPALACALSMINMSGFESVSAKTFIVWAVYD